MSILIKGADMSPDHIQCITVFPEGFAVVEEYDMLVPIKTTKCEVASVPTPHGRLIDADAVKKPIAATYYSQDEKDKAPRDDIPWMNGCNTKVKEVCWMIDDAPTVIEAEELEI